MPNRTSRCSARSAVRFRWVGNPRDDSVPALAQARQAFARVARIPGRLWDPYHWAITLAEFEARIKRAEAGRLIPVGQVKSIDRGDAIDLFEIKYDFEVVTILDDGSRAHGESKVRLYHAEPPSRPGEFLGLHLHEKTILPGDHAEENRLQNVEIDVAIGLYELGAASNWGL